jgi:hypothetical protein
MLTKLSSHYNLEILFPSIAEEWHPPKNRDLKPSDYYPKCACLNQISKSKIQQTRSNIGSITCARKKLGAHIILFLCKSCVCSARMDE